MNIELFNRLISNSDHVVDDADASLLLHGTISQVMYKLFNIASQTGNNMDASDIMFTYLETNGYLWLQQHKILNATVRDKLNEFIYQYTYHPIKLMAKKHYNNLFENLQRRCVSVLLQHKKHKKIIYLKNRDLIGLFKSEYFWLKKHKNRYIYPPLQLAIRIK